MGENPFSLYGDKKAYEALIEKVTKKLIESKKLVKNYWTSGDVVVESGWDGIGWQLHKSNPDIDFVAPKSGALGWIDTYAIPAKSKNAEGAYKLINFMLKPENAAFFTNKESYGTASLGSGKFLKKENKDNFARSFTKADIDNIKRHPPRHKNRECYLFMHHPPVPSGLYEIDQLANLKNSHQFWKLLDGYKNVKHIAFGHIHRIMHSTFNGVSLHATRSTTFQIALKLNDKKKMLTNMEKPTYAIMQLTKRGTQIYHHEYYNENRTYECQGRWD